MNDLKAEQTSCLLPLNYTDQRLLILAARLAHFTLEAAGRFISVRHLTHIQKEKRKTAESMMVM